MGTKHLGTLLIAASAAAMLAPSLPGRDLIRARNGVAESVRCGSGNDVALADPGDRVRGCETVDD